MSTVLFHHPRTSSTMEKFTNNAFAPLIEYEFVVIIPVICHIAVHIEGGKEVQTCGECCAYVVRMGMFLHRHVFWHFYVFILAYFSNFSTSLQMEVLWAFVARLYPSTTVIL